MSLQESDIPPELAEEFAVDFGATVRMPELRSASALPRALEFAAALGTVALVGALAWLSVANHAAVPFLWGVDLGIHEFGHMVTFWAPWQVTAAAGSGFQVTAPFALACYFLFARRQHLAAAICAAWAGTSARNVAAYIADAPFQRLPLWGGDGVQHDWATLLGSHAAQVAGPLSLAVEASAWLLIACAVALAVVPVVLRVRDARRQSASAQAFEARRDLLPVREPHPPIG